MKFLALPHIIGFFKTLSSEKILGFTLFSFSTISTELLLNFKMLTVQNWKPWLGLLILITIDLYWGIKKSQIGKTQKISIFKPSTWGEITSEGLRRTLRKIPEYITIIIAIHALETLFLKEPLELLGYGLTAIIFLIIAFVELWSIGENFKAVKGYNILEYFHKVFITRDFNSIKEELEKKE
jgi:hypothetical protein